MVTNEDAAVAFRKGDGNRIEIAVTSKGVCYDSGNRENGYEGVKEEAMRVEGCGECACPMTEHIVERHGG